MNVALIKERTYAARFLIGLLSGFLLVFASSVAVGGKGQDVSGLFAGAIVILLISIPAAAISAWISRRDLVVALLSQAMTIVGMLLIQFWH
jgi:hypothetical protein